MFSNYFLSFFFVLDKNTLSIMTDKIDQKTLKIRELKGFNQHYMAAELDISQRAYSKIEREETKLD